MPRTRLVIALVAFALVAAGCDFYRAAVEHRANDPDTRPWQCHSTGDGGGHHDVTQTAGEMTKGMLDWEDCLRVSLQFDLALDWALQYPTLGDAEAAGFHGLVPYVSGMGTHHALEGTFGPDDYLSPEFDPTDPRFPGTELDEHFNPTRPEFLQYGGNGPDAPLVGMSWYVRSEGAPPPGFRGDNDHWHVHHRLCMRRSNFTFAGEGLTDEECEARDGINLHLDNWWMVHAWIVPGFEHHPDVFVNHHPCLKWGGPAPHTDPCWAEATGAGH